MGTRRDQLSFLLDRRLRVMDLVIETLQGTAFELTVSPFDTVQDVKARISKVEGERWADLAQVELYTF